MNSIFTLIGASLALVACAGTEPIAPKPKTLVVGGSVGLEVHQWVVDDRDHAVARALAGLSDRAVPLHPDLVDRLRMNGFRVLACPAPEAERLLVQLRPVTPVQRRWFGMLSEWTELVAGPDMPVGVRTTTDTGVVEFAPGRLRLLARCWEVLAPVPTDSAAPSAAIRVELLPQYELSQRTDPLRAVLAPRRTVADTGVTFDRLRISWIAPSDEVLIIVAEAQTTDWNNLPAPFQPAPAPSEGVGPGQDAESPQPVSVNRVPSDVDIGPEPFEPPTVGELMLIGRDLTESAARAKVILVLIPRAPEVFELSPG